MSFYEIDFLAVEAAKSGDAIALRYNTGDEEFVHVVDGGYLETGQRLIEHINAYYAADGYIDHVVATHGDRDHTGGLRAVLEEFDVGTLWMLRPWAYADELLPLFPTYNSADRLVQRLKDGFPNLFALEEIAAKRGISIREPFQGAQIGRFTVLSPSLDRFLELVALSDKTPKTSLSDAATKLEEAMDYVQKTLRNLMKAAWGTETFSANETSANNEMSVIQYAELEGHKILLTGDAGRTALSDAADFAPFIGLQLPGLDKFQVPHHGSRRNVSTEVLNRWLGPIVSADVQPTFSAYCSSAKADEHHPRNAVKRAIIHRGGKFYATEGKTIQTGKNYIDRPGWTSITPVEYPEHEEEA